MAKRTSTSIDGSDAESAPERSPPATKRARVATTPDDRGSRSSEEAIDDGDEQDTEETDSALEIDDKEEQQFQSLSARWASQPRKTDIGGIAECGIIEKIECTNFMNHTLLTINLGPQINFIVGHNGTGKSALLTALVLGLGGTAAGTERGKSLAAFIKRDGSERAVISIKIKNRGDDAFKHDLYGDSIIVERTITKTSANYKLKSAAGAIISNKRPELSEMLDHFGIQVDNPLCVLMQEKAKAFLTASTPSTFYENFLRGTGLKQLADEYAAIHGTIIQASKDVQKLGEDIPRLKEEAKVANDRVDRCAALQVHEARLEELAGLMAWSYVVRHEESIEAALGDCESEEARVVEIEEMIEKAENAKEAVESTITVLEGRVQAQRDREQENELRLKELKELIDRVKAEIKDLRIQVQEINTEVQNERRDEEHIAESIKASTEEYEAKHSGATGDKQAKIDQFRAERDRHSAEHEKVRKTEMEADQSLDELNPVQGTLEADVSAARKALEEAEGRYRHICGQQKNPLAGFLPSTARILGKIQEASWKAFTPIGPVGSFVKLRDQTWLGIFESVLNENLEAYIVGHEDDRHQLIRTLRKEKNSAQVYKQAQDTTFDLRSGTPDPSLPTMLDKMTFENDVVRNALINHARIEQSILVDTTIVANEIMRREPKNVFNCYTKDGYKVSSGRSSSSTFYIYPRKGAPRLTADLTGYITDCQREVQEAQDFLKDRQAELTTLKGELASAERNKKVARDTLKRLRTKLGDIELNIKDLETQLIDDAPLDVQDLEDERRRKQRNIEVLTNQFTEIQSRIQQCLERMKPDVQEKERIQASERQREELTAGLESELTDLVEKRLQAETDLKHWLDRLERQRQKISTSRLRYEQLQADLAGIEEQASEVCAARPSNVTSSSAQYQTEYLRVEKARDDARRREGGMTLEEVQRAAVDANLHYRSGQKQHHQFRIFMQALKSAHQIRLQRWRYIRRNTSWTARQNFIRNVSMRGFVGDMRFGHDKGQIDLYVLTDPEKAKGLGAGNSRGSKSLSGGEKSYSTVSMLLALWHTSSAPLRCLDEYDVFMDAVNRLVATNMIVDVGKTANGRQHILVSPNSVSQSVYSRPYVRVSRLGDNQRGQGVIAGTAVLET